MTFEQEIGQLKRTDKNETRSIEKTRFEITVNQRELDEPTREEKMSSLANSLLTIDMIECSRVRVNEILSEFMDNKKA